MSIPDFPEFKLLELSDREEVEEFFRKYSPETSDYSFANLFIWRNYDQPKLTLVNGNLCILLEPAGGSPYFLAPVGEAEIEKTLHQCFGYLKKHPQLRMVPEKFVKKYFEKKIEYRFELDRANSDYVYRTSDLINLKGRKYDGKRNWIKKFLANYSAQYVPLTSDLLPVSFDLLERWAKTRQGALLRYEIQAIAEALNHLKELRLIARAVPVSGKLEAFMVGGELNPEMAIVYVQIANREIPGLPQYFHQKFAAEELSNYKYVNWEQDLGIPGLRKAKLSYHPCRLIHKFDVSWLRKA